MRKKIRIEFLFPEAADLFGELGDMDYLQQIFPRGEFIRTQIMQKPFFIENDCDLVFMAPRSERVQALALERLMPYKEAIRRKVEDGMHFLFLGNAQELFGAYIEADDGSKMPCLDIFPIYAKQQMMNRLSSLFLGDKDGLPIVGAKAQFTQLYETDPSRPVPAFCEVRRGIGRHENAEKEGIHYKNFIGTSILGPFLLANPPFTERWLKSLSGISYLKLPHADLAFKAYHKRLEELRDPRSTL